MLKLIHFIKRVSPLLLFLVLEGVALHTYAGSSDVRRAMLLSRSNAVVGGFYNSLSGIEGYFGLRRANRMLLDEVARLNNQLTRYREQEVFLRLDSLAAQIEPRYGYLTARVVKNSINSLHNFITLNKGVLHGVEPDMAVITPDGAMVGYVVSCSDKYSVCISLLNTSFRTSGKLAGGDRFGSVFWEGTGARRVRMNELSKYADVHLGDTILSTGYSHYFPEGLRIGTVAAFEIDETTSSYRLQIDLAADMTALGDVVLVKNFDFYETQALEQEAQKLF